MNVVGDLGYDRDMDKVKVATMFCACKLELEDYESQTNMRVTRNLVRDLVTARVPTNSTREEKREIVSMLVGVFCR